MDRCYRRLCCSHKWVVSTSAARLHSLAKRQPIRRLLNPGTAYPATSVHLPWPRHNLKKWKKRPCAPPPVGRHAYPSETPQPTAGRTPSLSLHGLSGSRLLHGIPDLCLTCSHSIALEFCPRKSAIVVIGKFSDVPPHQAAGGDSLLSLRHQQSLCHWDTVYFFHKPILIL